MEADHDAMEDSTGFWSCMPGSSVLAASPALRLPRSEEAGKNNNHGRGLGRETASGETSNYFRGEGYQVAGGVRAPSQGRRG